MTELNDRAGASTNTGANRCGSRRGAIGPERCGLMDLRQHHRAACAIGVDALRQRAEIVGDEFVAEVGERLTHAFAIGDDRLRR
jgi:hypothetical protein